MIILDITIIKPGSEVGKKLGNPQTWTEESAASAPPQTTMQPAPKVAALPTQSSNQVTSLDSSSLASQMTHPIASLSPYQNK